MEYSYNSYFNVFLWIVFSLTSGFVSVNWLFSLWWVTFFFLFTCLVIFNWISDINFIFLGARYFYISLPIFVLFSVTQLSFGNSLIISWLVLSLLGRTKATIASFTLYWDNSLLSFLGPCKLHVFLLWLLRTQTVPFSVVSVNCFLCFFWMLLLFSSWDSCHIHR